MILGDIKSLDAYLADHSYVDGYVPSQSDASHFEAITKPPTNATPHALRWYNHIKSFGSEIKNFTGEKKITKTPSKPEPSKPAAKDDDDDLDLFGSDDEEDAEAAKIREERLKEYAAKKSKKPALIAKSSIVLDVKPWDDETDMKQMEEKVRSIQKDGLVWGASKLVPLAFGIKKLQIMCVVEDEKISVDLLTEEIQEFEDLVQSVDVAAFNKI
ncbi:elongation factor 1-beta'-like [Ischnura elegans]|uniref:elongation factor 1-beta'-like n=1 Tax=Ischnura elegans TaxID=197161 RepID=UPI001ED86697|nr:elongation factor 1-beta'-like [Ischnura elegans]